MTIRPHELETIAPVIASFKIKQTGGVDDLKDADIGCAVTLSDDVTVTKASDGDLLLGKLVTLTLTDAQNGDRLASVQIGGICRLPTGSTYPTLGDRVVCGANGVVKQAPALGGNDPAGGNVARGTTLEVNGTTDCLLLLN